MRCNTGPTLNNKYAHILVVNLVSGTVDQMPANDLVCPVVYGLMEM